MSKKKLPTGTHSFREIREEGCYYVDKTAFAAKLIDGAKHNFLSRPRRFGKSLFVDTLKNLFEGKKELFKGLDIYEKWDWEVEYPVVRLDFTGGQFTEPGQFQADIIERLDEAEELAGVSTGATTVPGRFRRLINKLAEKKKQRVVILVDEYDKPIFDALGTPGLAETNREILRGLYSTIKQCNENVRFSFLTGVSKFAQAGIFSGLNNLTDITLDPEFSSICGYTDHDIDTVFAPELVDFDREEIRDWYNGYNWRGKVNVYNPFSILQLFTKREFKSWWFETGTPKFLVDTLDRNGSDIVGLEGSVIGDDIMSGFDVDRIDTAVLMFQTGYLTITKETPTSRGSSYRLECPNREVRMSLYGALLQHLAPVSAAEHERRLNTLEHCVETGDIEGIKPVLSSLFSLIPHQWHAKGELAGYEAYFGSMICAAFRSTGMDVRPEEPASGGRVDIAIVTATRVVLFEIKVLKGNVKKGDAMRQLRERDYADRYRYLGLPIHLVAVECDSSPGKRNIAFFDVELD